MVESYCVPFKVINYFEALKERVVEFDLMGFIAIIKRFQDKRRLSTSYINHYKTVALNPQQFALVFLNKNFMMI